MISKLCVVSNAAHLQKETFGAFYIKLYLKHLQKSDLKTTQNPQKQPSEDVLKKAVLKRSAKLAVQQLCRSLSFNKVAEDSIIGFFPWLLAKEHFVTYKRLLLNPRTYSSRSLETIAIAKNLETCHEYKFVRRTMLKCERISLAFFEFKNLMNDKWLVAGCARFAKLRAQGSVVEFFPSVTQNSYVMLSKDIKLVEGCLY